FKIAYENMRKAISSYKKEIKHQKLEDIQNKINEINSNAKLTDNEKIKKVNTQIELHNKIKLELEEKEKQVVEYNKRLMELKQTAVEKGWEDFSRQVSLKGSYQKYEGALQAFSEAIKEFDLTLLSNKHRELLESFLGVSVQELQARLEKDPIAFKKEMLSFFGGSDADLLMFIRRQNKIEELTNPPAQP
ncbi:MAG: hypothetical protein Q8K60_06590, partial [Parachlamydiaceae bacterium]|nr:hypothetical protein [Parachlamydiaceae bacterium]